MTKTQAAFVLGVVTGAGGAVLAGLILGWPTGYLRERGRQRAEATGCRNAAKSEEKRAAAKAEADKVAAMNARHNEEQEIELLRRERVGARFRWKASKEDVGMIGTVIRLAEQQSRLRVVVDFESPVGRPPTKYDYQAPTSIEWKVLTAPDDEQIHRTARMNAKSFDDNDGWVEFEQLPREPS